MDDDDQPDDQPDDRYPGRNRDVRLVDRARVGDERAFGRLYDLWFDRVYGVALGIVRQPEVAAEVAQDAFLSAWRSLDSLEDPRVFGGWLLRITRNGALNRRAKEQRSSPVDEAGIGRKRHAFESIGEVPAGSVEVTIDDNDSDRDFPLGAKRLQHTLAGCRPGSCNDNGFHNCGLTGWWNTLVVLSILVSTIL